MRFISNVFTKSDKQYLDSSSNDAKEDNIMGFGFGGQATAVLTPTASSKTLSEEKPVRSQDALQKAFKEGNIRELAYLKWEASGSPEGQDEYFWLEAEKELLANG